MAADCGEERLAQIIGLPRADALDGQQRVDRPGPQACHLSKRGVVEDHVRWDAARPSDLEPNRTEAFEQRAVDRFPRLGLDARLQARRPLARRLLAREPEIRIQRSILHEGESLRRQGQDRILAASLLQEAESYKLLDVAANLGYGRVRKKTKRAQLVVTSR